MLRDVLKKVLMDYPAARAGGDVAFTGHPLANFVRQAARDTVLEVAREVSPNPGNLRAKGSVGDVQRWTQTPWIAVMDSRDTGSVQEGVYIVYLFAADCEDVYLTVNQGCTTLYNAQTRYKERSTSADLRRRAEVMLSRIGNRMRLTLDDIELRGTIWRSRLYEAGTVCGVRYSRSQLPSEADLRADLQEAMGAYDRLIRHGTWASEDSIIHDASEDGMSDTLTEARVYRQHRKIERSSKTAVKVKRALGYRCMACETDMAERYGDLGLNYIEAHHLKPLSSYSVDERVELDPRHDFAVLCPNCHRMIHRMENTSDIEGLKAVLASKCRRSDDAS